ncbi:MAG: hypothetical protein SVY53_08715 [Chloroflexota bacterium]|nr:hypothetical protein [Chloroflexota bacterium]
MRIKKLAPSLLPVLIIAVVLMMPIPTSKVTNQAAQATGGDSVLDSVLGLQVPFVQNLGQVEQDTVRFYSHTFGGTVFIEDDGVLTYHLPSEDGACFVIKEYVADAAPVIPQGTEQSPTGVSYFVGNDPQNWDTDIPTYNSVLFSEVIEGVSVSLKAYGNNIEKVFIVQPGVSPQTIVMGVDGAEELSINQQGQLEVITPKGIVAFTEPVAYQDNGGKRQDVEVAYVLHDEDHYGFEIGDYDPSLVLTIDPLLASTYVGGTDDDAARSIAIGNDGSIYIAGYALSDDYPHV